MSHLEWPNVETEPWPPKTKNGGRWGRKFLIDGFHFRKMKKKISEVDGGGGCTTV